MLPNCASDCKIRGFLLKAKSFSTWLIYCRNCLAAHNWGDYWMNCSSCLPQCDSVDYSIINREYEMYYYRDSRILKIKTYVNKSRIKRDLLFSIDYLIGGCSIGHSIWFTLKYIWFVSIHLKSIVSIGGAAALFLGCSFISVAEIFYFLAKHFQQNRTTTATIQASQP